MENNLYNIPAEQAILGSILLNNDFLYKINGIINSQHFYHQGHQLIFDTCQDLISERMVADPITLKKKFDDCEWFKDLGGAKYLINLGTLVPNTANLKGYANTVKKLAQKRALLGAMQDIQAKINNDDIQASEILTDLYTQLQALDDEQLTGDSCVDIGNATTSVLKEIEGVITGKVEIPIIPTGLKDVDDVFGGYKKSELTIIGGRPAMGKTALVLDQIYHTAKHVSKNNETSLFFSLEMSRSQIIKRMLARESGVLSSKLNQYNLNDSEYTQLSRSSKKLPQNIIINDGGGMNIDVLCATARTLHRKRNVGIIFIDHIGFLRSSVKGEFRIVVKDISSKLQALAKQLDIPIVALSQLSRNLESREDKTPIMADLRESGDLEQDANNVIFIHREKYYHDRKKPVVGSRDYEYKMQEWLEVDKHINNKAMIVFGKVREGTPCQIMVGFDPTISKFYNL